MNILKRLLFSQPEKVEESKATVASPAQKKEAKVFTFSKRSTNNLASVHPLIRKVFNEVIKRSSIDFIVIEGVRTAERQKQLVAEGKSWTNNSYHLYGLAIDLVPLINGKISWNLKDFSPIITLVEEVAKEMDIDIRSGHTMWGKDAPHFQLHTIDGKPSREVYDVRKLNA